jgi:ATP-binding cassette subfamily F protein 3
LKTLLGELPAKSGLARLGASVHIGYFAQAHADLNLENTLEQEIQAAAPDLRTRDLRGFLARYLFSSDDLKKPIEVLSGGERARVALMRLILEGANFLLLDEPTNHLDLLAQEALQEALEQFPGTILLVSHDRYLVRALTSEIWHVDSEAQELKVYPHGYEEFLQARIEERGRQGQVKDVRKPSPQAASSGKSTTLPSLARVEAQIEAIEAELDALNIALVAAGEDFKEQARLGKRYRQLEAELEKNLKLWERVAHSAESA